MHNFSYAGAGAGGEDPDDVTVVLVNEDNCPKDRCGEDGVHLVIMWQGDEYSNRNTWISAEEGTYTDLDDMR
jgi:hypothetical protein